MLRTSPGPRASTPSYVSRVLGLTPLAPEIVEAILDGRQPVELQLDDLLEGFPSEWQAQPAAAGGITGRASTSRDVHPGGVIVGPTIASD